MHKSLQQFFRAFFVLKTLMAICLTTDLYATHIALGGEIYHEQGSFYVGGQYQNLKITLNLYYDCKAFDTPYPGVYSQSVSIQSSLSGQPMFLSPANSRMEDVTPKCTGLVSPCKSPSGTIGITKLTFTYYTQYNNSEAWIRYDACCRNANLSNLVNPSSLHFFLESYFYTTNNNSLKLVNESVPILFSGEKKIISHEATDADGDSLIYELSTPKNGPNMSAIFIPPYSPHIG